MDFDVFVFFGESTEARFDHLFGPWTIRKQPQQPEAGVIGGYRQQDVLSVGFLL
jgi:hypothetical protein